MTPNDRDQTPADLAWVAERLEQERPVAGPLELDRMKLRARTQAMRGARSQAKGSVLKSRVAIAAILMLGLMTGGTGTTLALSEGSDSAAVSQYGQGQSNDRVLGTTQQDGQGGGPGSNGVRGTTGSSNGVQGSQQVVATDGGDSTLPFTGLAALPLVALGLGLMVAGAILYRSARREPSSA